MRSARGVWTGIVLFIFFFVGFSATFAKAEDSDIQWHSYSEGIKKIKEENKKGFIHFYTDWCTYCKRMDQKTFINDSVAVYLNEHYIPIRVNGDEQKAVTREYGVKGFPTNGFIAEDQSPIGSRPGFIPADIFLEMLKFIETDSFKKMSFQAYLDKKS